MGSFEQCCIWCYLVQNHMSSRLCSISYVQLGSDRTIVEDIAEFQCLGVERRPSKHNLETRQSQKRQSYSHVVLLKLLSKMPRFFQWFQFKWSLIITQSEFDYKPITKVLYLLEAKQKCASLAFVIVYLHDNATYHLQLVKSPTQHQCQFSLHQAMVSISAVLRTKFWQIKHT